MEKDNLEEVLELEREIAEFLQRMVNSDNKEDCKLYKQMIQVNITIIKGMLKSKKEG